MLDDPDGEVSAAAACALGRMGKVEARIHLKRYLTERPSGRVVEAVAGVADDEAIVMLARVGRARADLALSIISALEEIERKGHVRRLRAKKVSVQGGTTLTYEARPSNLLAHNQCFCSDAGSC